MRNISENFKKHFQRFRVKFWKILSNRHFRNFWEIFQKIWENLEILQNSDVFHAYFYESKSIKTETLFCCACGNTGTKENRYDNMRYSITNMLCKFHARALNETVIRSVFVNITVPDPVQENGREEFFREQWYVIKACLPEGLSCIHTFNRLRLTYRDAIMSCLPIYRWYESFERGGTSAALQGGRSTPSWSIHEVNINTAAAVIEEEPVLTIRQVTEILDVLYRSAQTMLTKELCFSSVCARWVHHLLTLEMKDARVCMCKIWRDKLAEDETWFDNVIILDKEWMYCHKLAMNEATSC